MRNAKEIKELVKEKYGQIAEAADQDGCCGGTTDCGSDYSVFTDDYTELAGHNPDADLGLGCGLPTEFAQIKTGDTVVDLGSGAGNDCFVARAQTGESGKVIGIDMTESMVAKAKRNAEKLGFENIEFHLGEIEELPLSDNSTDVVVSNCVFNLVPDKKMAFTETYRILKPGGHFSISDVIVTGDLPDSLRESAEAYAGCVAGAIDKDLYLDIIKEAGFKNITLQKEKEIQLPDSLLKEHLSLDQQNDLEKAKLGIYSITVYAEKDENCCEPTCCD